MTLFSNGWALVIASGFICYPLARSASFSVMTWNTWHCGLKVLNGRDKLAFFIDDKAADIVFLQEAIGCADDILWRVNEVGNSYKRCKAAAYDLAILYNSKRFAEVDESSSGKATAADSTAAESTLTSNWSGKFLERATTVKNHDTHLICQLRDIQTNVTLSLINIHGCGDYYGPEVACGIKARAKPAWSLEEELFFHEFEHRQKPLFDVLERFVHADELAKEITILAGDLSSPSTLDFGPGTAAGHCGLENFTWPVTAELSRHRFIDSFRELHPNSQANPGITYSEVYNGTMVQNVRYPQERRDFVYYRPGASRTLRPREASVYIQPLEHRSQWYYEPGDAPSAEVLQNMWPSDHAAVYVEFELQQQQQGNKPEGEYYYYQYYDDET